jgi:hypothetical protein
MLNQLLLPGPEVRVPKVAPQNAVDVAGSASGGNLMGNRSSTAVASVASVANSAGSASVMFCGHGISLQLPSKIIDPAIIPSFILSQHILY